MKNSAAEKSMGTDYEEQVQHQVQSLQALRERLLKAKQDSRQVVDRVRQKKAPTTPQAYSRTASVAMNSETRPRTYTIAATTPQVQQQGQSSLSMGSKDNVDVQSHMKSSPRNSKYNPRTPLPKDEGQARSILQTPSTKPRQRSVLETKQHSAAEPTTLEERYSSEQHWKKFEEFSRALAEAEAALGLSSKHSA